MRREKQLWKVAIIVAILILVLVLIYSGLQILESTVLLPKVDVPEESTGKTIYRDDVAYFPRQDITVILLSGVDTVGPMEDSGSYNNSAQADSVNLLIFDKTANDVDIITLNRDSMVEMPVLGLGGKPAGTRVAQLALAHTYGNGLEQSSRNLVSTVSDLMYGVHIDHYVTLNMDAIAILNDAVGGVTVEVTEDFSDVDPTIPMGKVRLTGKQAVSYIRIRRDVDDQLNLSRMERHEKYMDAFFKQLKEKLGEDSSFAVSLFQDLGDHMVTDCDVTTLSNLVKKYGDGELGQILSIKGENVLGEKYYEYYLDEDDLDRVIVDHLYEPKK